MAFISICILVFLGLKFMSIFRNLSVSDEKQTEKYLAVLILGIFGTILIGSLCGFIE